MEHLIYSPETSGGSSCSPLQNERQQMADIPSRFLSLISLEEPPVPACQCHVMLLQYQCPERFPLAGLSTQQSTYGTACQMMLLVTSLK